MNTNNLDIANRAIRNLEDLTEFSGNFGFSDYPDASSGKNAKIAMTLNGRRIEALCLIKREFLPHHLAEIAPDKKSKRQMIIIAEKISAKMMALLRDRRIGYLDACGNFFFCAADLFIWIEGRKSKIRFKSTRNKAFTKSGVKLTGHLLMDESLLNLPYRELAEVTGASLGNVNYIINGLAEMGFIPLKLRGKMKLNNKKRLIENWTYAYSEKYKPAIYKGTFRFIDSAGIAGWKKINFNNRPTFWGGEPAADLLTKYIRPEYLTIYTKESIAVLMKTCQMIPDPEGNIKVYDLFWEERFNVRPGVAHPLIIFADLMGSGDGRCIEVAEKIYNEYLSE